LTLAQATSFSIKLIQDYGSEVGKACEQYHRSKAELLRAMALISESGLKDEKLPPLDSES
jgi:hypothetical protein